MTSLEQVLSVSTLCGTAVVHVKDYQCCAKWLEELNLKL